MISLGIDPSSSTTGIAVARDDKLEYINAFFSDKKLPLEVNMSRLGYVLTDISVAYGGWDVVVIEKVSVRWNVNTIRKIAYFEAVGLLHAADMQAPAVQVQATRARKLVLGHGGLSKEETYVEVVSRMGTLQWKPKNKGGMDETDAAVLALAGPALFEERT